MLFHFTKKHSFWLSPVILFGIFFAVYQLHAQEETTLPVEESSSQNSTTTDPGDSQNIIEEIINIVTDVEGPEISATTTPAAPEIIPEALLPAVLEDLPSIPAPFINHPFIPVREEFKIKKNDIDYTNGSYACSAEPFLVNITNSTDSSTINIKNLNNAPDLPRKIEVGGLPAGIKVVFSGDSYTKEITGNETSFSVSVDKEPGAQKGSFTVPIFYSIGDTTVVCQMNVVNNG